MLECTEALPLLLMALALVLLLVSLAVGRWAQREMDRLERMAIALRREFGGGR